MKRCARQGNATSLTLIDVLNAAMDASGADSPAIVQALFESGRIRFASPTSQREVDRLARLVHPGNRTRTSASPTAGAA